MTIGLLTQEGWTRAEKKGLRIFCGMTLQEIQEAKKAYQEKNHFPTDNLAGHDRDFYGWISKWKKEQERESIPSP